MPAPLSAPTCHSRLRSSLGISLSLALLSLSPRFGGLAFAQPIEDATGSFYPAAPAAGAAPEQALIISPPAAGSPQAAAASAPMNIEALPQQAVPPVQDALPPSVVMPAPQQAAQPAGPPVIAVLDFQSSTLSRQDVAALTEALWAQLSRPGTVRLLPRDATRRWLIANDLHPFMPYGPHISMSKVIDRLHAQYLLTGTIDRIENAYSLELEVYGPASEVPLLKEAGARVASLDQMLLAMNGLADESLGSIGAASGYRLTSLNQSRDWSRAGSSSRAEGIESVSARSASQVKTSAPAKTRVSPSTGARDAAYASAAQSGSEPSPDSMAMANPESTPSKAATPSTSIPVERSKPAASAQPKMQPGLTSTPIPTPLPTATPAPTPSPAPQKALPASQSDQAAKLFKDAMALPVTDANRLSKLEQAVKLDPANAAMTQQLGFDYFQWARYADSLALCDQALKLSPKDSQLLMIKGSAQISLQQWAGAIESCRASAAADPANHYALYNLALALEMSGSPDAPAAWRDYLDKSQNDPQQQTLLPEARQRLDALQKKTP